MAYLLPRVDQCSDADNGPRALAASLRQGVAGIGGESFIGSVRYLGEQDIFRFAERVLPTKIEEPAEQARTLLIKRRAFSHEREVRLIWVRTGDSGTNGLARCPISPKAVIDQLMLDPRLERKRAQRLQDDIHERTGFQRDRILRSLLYTLPPRLATLARSHAPSV